MSNREFWDRVQKTDPRRVKPITGKPYKGNSPQPYYLVERMTEEFGMCGIGWGIKILSERMERLTDTDVLHIAHIELWYMQGEKRASIEQVGQTKAAYVTNKGPMMVDEDAPKKSVTDAMTKCMSYLGFSGDIFSGHWDDSKYVDAITKEFTEADMAAQVEEAAKQAQIDLQEAASQINAAATPDTLKAVYAGWYKYFVGQAEKDAVKALYDDKKATFQKPIKKAA